MLGQKVLFCVCVLAMFSVLDGQVLGGPMHGKVVVCYIGTWAAYRPDAGKFELEALEPSLCTHLVYSFAGLDPNSHSIKSLDPWQDLEKDYGKAGFKRIVSLKDRYPHLKVSIAIGGWNEGSPKYSEMAANQTSRAKFIKSVLLFLDQNKFDGLDLDWEYPAKRGGKPEDKENFVALVKELKDAFEPYNYLLTAALGVGKDTMEAAYDLAKLSRYLDFIHMMCYDYHGTWDRVVGANAPLKGDENDPLTVEYTIKYMLDHKVSPYKMVMGLPLYGRTFVLQNPDVKEVEFGRTSVKEQGFQGPYTREAGFMGYNEICTEMTNKSSKWIYNWHETSMTPYLRDGDKFITFDDERSIAAKVKVAMDYGLGGLMVWSIDTDDFRGHCAQKSNAFVDFEERYHSIVDDPVLHEALKTLALPDANERESLNKQTAYVISNGKLYLRLPEAKFSNYALMRTINAATTLALEEKRILDEMDRVARENEIDDDKNKPGLASALSSSIFSVFMALFISFKF